MILRSSKTAPRSFRLTKLLLLAVAVMALVAIPAGVGSSGIL